MKFLGTSAADSIPNLHCQCAHCMEARKRQGKDIRMRASFLLDENNLIDIGQDINAQSQKFNLELFKLRNIFITHSHEDHFSLNELLNISHAHKNGGANGRDKLNVYISKPAYGYMEKLYAAMRTSPFKGSTESQYVNFIPLDYFENYEVGDMKIYTLKGNHDAYGEGEKSINYIFTLKNGVKVLYASDTGYYPDETFDHLEGKMDYVIMECCTTDSKNKGKRAGSHLDIKGYLEMLDEFKKRNFIDENTKIYATHMSHSHDLMHQELQDTFDESRYKVVVAYDGLDIC
ncbi:MBL fold metallo-hydrolase [Vallitalea sediminicola]